MVEHAPKKTSETDARIKALLTGEAPAPNEFVEYLVESARKTHREVVTLENNIQHADEQLTNWKNELWAKRGEMQKTIDDLVAWDRPVTPPVPAQNAPHS